MPVLVGGRQIYINTRDTQTVKICTPRNERGVYEKYYRIEPGYGLQPAQMEKTITGFPTLADLERWLVEDRKATREPENEAAPLYGQSAFTTEEKNCEDAEKAIPEALSAPASVAEVLNILRSRSPWLHTAFATEAEALNFWRAKLEDHGEVQENYTLKAVVFA